MIQIFTTAFLTWSWYKELKRYGLGIFGRLRDYTDRESYTVQCEWLVWVRWGPSLARAKTTLQRKLTDMVFLEWVLLLRVVWTCLDPEHHIFDSNRNATLAIKWKPAAVRIGLLLILDEWWRDISEARFSLGWNFSSKSEKRDLNLENRFQAGFGAAMGRPAAWQVNRVPLQLWHKSSFST